MNIWNQKLVPIQLKQSGIKFVFPEIFYSNSYEAVCKTFALPTADGLFFTQKQLFGSDM